MRRFIEAAKALTDCSGVVPTIMIVNGPAVSGPALLLGVADHVVMTAKDAVKLRDRWPVSVPEPLVATLAVTFESGETALRNALDLVVARIG